MAQQGWGWAVVAYGEYILSYVDGDPEVWIHRGQECFGCTRDTTLEGALERARMYVDRVLYPVYYPRGEAY